LNTIDLTTWQLLFNKRLEEKTIRTVRYYGGEHVDVGFLTFIGKEVGSSAIQLLQENHYGQLQYMVYEFRNKVKHLFTGNKQDYKTFELDLDEVCPVIKQYVRDDKREQLEDNEWIVELKFENVKRMFDPVVKRIIKLIRDQLDHSDAVSAMFLVGGFSESKYLQNRIHEEFSDEIRNISVPSQPMAAVVRGGNYKIVDCKCK